MKMNLIHLGLTPTEYREIVEALRLAKTCLEEGHLEHDMAVDDAVEYLNNALEILNER